MHLKDDGYTDWHGSYGTSDNNNISAPEGYYNFYISKKYGTDGYVYSTFLGKQVYLDNMSDGTVYYLLGKYIDEVWTVKTNWPGDELNTKVQGTNNYGIYMYDYTEVQIIFYPTSGGEFRTGTIYVDQITNSGFTARFNPDNSWLEWTIW